jgi:2-dehydropantoate 2-reductase
MRYIIYGAGGIGCTIGGRLALAGYDVALIARGSQLDALQTRGLILKTPDGNHHLELPAFGSPAEMHFSSGDVVILTMKTQDTAGALAGLEAVAGPGVPVVCAQNGVENERMAARRFANVYAMLVALPATFLEPGEVIASGAPLSGAIHAGRYPSGIDDTVTGLCEALNASHFTSIADPEPMRFKYRKLLLNLGNALELLTPETSWGNTGQLGEFANSLRDEALRCYEAAGIDAMSADEYRERVTSHYAHTPVEDNPRSGSSTLQGLLRGNQTSEVDYLNGEIVLLGALHGVPTPRNTLVRNLAAEVMTGQRPPRKLAPSDLIAMAASVG